MLWTDKYRPKTLDEVVGNNKEKALIQKWVDNWKAGNPQKPLLKALLENPLPANHYLEMTTNYLFLMK